MLSSITPLGERGRHNRYSLTVTAYLVGSVLGGATSGALFGALGLPLRWAGVSDTAIAIAAGVVALLALVFEAGRSRLRLPSIRRQVNEDWMTIYRGWVYGLGWGFELGLGIVTIATTATIYVIFALAVLSGSPLTGMVLGATFGLARGLAILTARRVRTPDALLAFHRSLQRIAPAAHVASIVANGTVILAAVLVLTR